MSRVWHTNIRIKGMVSVNIEAEKEIEFFRNACILVPKKKCDRYHTVLIPAQERKKKNRVFCNCSIGKEPKCSHVKLLLKHYSVLKDKWNGNTIETHFAKSPFKLILGAITKIIPTSIDNVTIETDSGISPSMVVKNGDNELLVYHSGGKDAKRFHSRISPGERFSRAWLMNKSMGFIETEYERAMRVLGHKTVRMLEENSIWHRLAYHCFMEFSYDDIELRLLVDDATAVVWLHADIKNMPLFSIPLPSKAVTGVCDTIYKYAKKSSRFNLADNEAELLFIIKQTVNNEIVHLVPVAKINNEKSRNLYPVRSCHCYGTTGYDPETSRFFKFNSSSLQRLATGWHTSKSVKRIHFSEFINTHIAALSIGTIHGNTEFSHQMDLFGKDNCNDLKRIVEPCVIHSFDRIELHLKSVRGSQWTIELIYCSDEKKVNLSQLLYAQAKSDTYLLTEQCIVDMKSKKVAEALAQAKGIGSDGVLSLSSMSLMLLKGGAITLQFEGEEKLKKKILRMFSGKTRKKIAFSNDFTCTLRSYQAHGVTWLHFLYDYYLGGLLCDEMGLGKTIQIIACVNSIKTLHKKIFSCIVCPTSVVSHWVTLFARFSPSIKIVDYTTTRHIPKRSECDVLLLSYGLMRNDVETLVKNIFDMIIFDEVQQLKNKNTAGYRAACQLRGRVVVGLTGTPIENTAEDLEALFNLVLPGLSIDIPSETALLNTISSPSETHEIARFRRRIEPFILRRTKNNVLTELPEKTEENRYCTLSPFQEELYYEALKQRGKPLVESLRNHDSAIPYMHIFSLLSYLKQVCNTPALASGTLEEYTLNESGKWELFKELLDESLGSGQKVVVFTQFLGMVDIITRYCKSINVEAVTLTGQSKAKQRDKNIKHFNNDHSCKVFIGSLKAGGVGIDLIAASVVIHFDRWWNAARENQATDRVHRIGQTRGVQVFKLITRYSIEERIDKIIQKKKTLFDQALSEDDPNTIKHFSREELIELITPVGLASRN